MGRRPCSLTQARPALALGAEGAQRYLAAHACRGIPGLQAGWTVHVTVLEFQNIVWLRSTFPVSWTPHCNCAQAVGPVVDLQAIATPSHRALDSDRPEFGTASQGDQRGHPPSPFAGTEPKPRVVAPTSRPEFQRRDGSGLRLPGQLRLREGPEPCFKNSKRRIRLLLADPKFRTFGHTGFISACKH